MLTLRFAFALLPLFPKRAGLCVLAIWLFAKSRLKFRFKVFYIRSLIALVLFRQSYRFFRVRWKLTARDGEDFSKFLEAQRLAPNKKSAPQKGPYKTPKPGSIPGRVRLSR